MKPPLSRTALLLATVVAVGCNATGVAPLPRATPVLTTSPTSAMPAITTPTALRGTWTAEVTGTTASSGVWTLRVSESNLSLQNPVGGDPFTLDPTSFTPTSIVFPPASDCPDQSVATPGTYGLVLSGDALTITLVSDSCGDRSAVLVSGSWSRQP